MGPSPAGFVKESPPRSLARAFPGFKHRFTTGEELGRLLVGVRNALAARGSLNALFNEGIGECDDTVIPALSRFTSELTGLSGGSCDFLLPDPARGSACKRLNLYLRWMVRRDEVDPGGWKGIPLSALVIPLDTHMYRAGLRLRFTERRSADLRAALEITGGFRAIVPDDPVRYDFSLTRLGIRDDESLDAFLDKVDEAQ